MAIYKFFKTVFASSGDVATIPEDHQTDGTVSFTDGYGSDYALDPGNPDVLYPERDKMNGLFEDITGNIQQWQVHAIPDFITSSDNGGSAYPYDKYSLVRYTGQIYYSLVDANTALPSDATKWALLISTSIISTFQTGMMMEYEDITLPSGGWVWANGTTVGDASSNATGRANADTVALFTQIWTAFPNSVRPIINSDGSAGSRGANAAADYAAHKALPVRDKRCVVSAGTATMGGTSNRGLLTGYKEGVNSSVFGATGGEQAHAPITDEMATHSHGLLGINTNQENNGGNPQSLSSLLTGGSLTVPYTLVGAGLAISGHVAYVSSNRDGQYVSNVGAGQNFNIVQPTTICNYIIKL